MNEKEQSKAVMEYKAQSGDMIRIDPQMVRDFLIQGKRELVTVQEIFYFMHMCKARKLNPFVKDCYLIKYGSEAAAIVTSVDYFRKNARKADDCRGWRCGVIIIAGKEIIEREGSLVLDSEVLVGGWAQAQPDGWTDPKKHTVNLAPYIKKTRDGRITKFWAEDRQPDMIMKVAETQLLRQVWGEESTGMYTPEEMPSLEDMSSGPLETTVIQSDTVKRLKPESADNLKRIKPEEEKPDRPKTHLGSEVLEETDEKPPIKSYPQTIDDPSPSERKRTGSGQFEKEKGPGAEEASSEEQVEPATDAIPPEWEHKVWFKKKTSGFTTHVWTNLKTMPDVLEGEVRQKWFKLHGKEVPFPKDVDKPAENDSGPDKTPPEDADVGDTAALEKTDGNGVVVFHDIEDFDAMPAKIKEIYLELANLNACETVEVDPILANRVIKTRFPKEFEAARVQLNYGMIVTSAAAADLWNEKVGDMLEGKNF